MSGRKNFLAPFDIFTADAMVGTLTSPPTNIQHLDDIGIQLVWTGNGEGTFDIQVSATYEQDTNGNVTNPGTWTSLTLSPSITAAGTPDSAYIDITQHSAPWIRTVFTDTMQESVDITTVADVTGSLNSTYFLIDGSDGDDWYVWLDNGTGVDPMVAGRTGIQVVYTDDDTASAIAGFIRTALAACTSIETIGGSTSHVTFEQVDPGPGNVEDGADATGFNFAYTAGTGVLDGVIVAKMV